MNQEEEVAEMLQEVLVGGQHRLRELGTVLERARFPKDRDSLTALLIAAAVLGKQGDPPITHDTFVTMASLVYRSTYVSDAKPAN